MATKTTPPARKPGATPPARLASIAPTSIMPAAPSSAPLPRLLSLAQAAEVLGCSLKTLRRRIKDGDLPVIRDGRLVRVHPQDLARYVAARRSL